MGIVPTLIELKSASGYCSRLEWAQALLEMARARIRLRAEVVEPAESHEFPARAERPRFSALDWTRLDQRFHLRLPYWRDALELAVDSWLPTREGGPSE